MKFYVLAFSHIWLSPKNSKSTKGNHLNNVGITQIPDATCQVQRHRSIGSRQDSF